MYESFRAWTPSGDAVAAPTETICIEIVATCGQAEALMKEAMACVAAGDLDGARAKKEEADGIRMGAASKLQAAQAERAKIPPIEGRPGQ